MARLIRTEKEVEGRYEEVWLVVEEDALQQWPAGARTTVGRPATRTDGLQRARGEAIFTADLRLNGMLHTAVLRSPHAAASRRPHRPGAGACAAGRARGGRARRDPAARRRLQLPGPGRRGRLRRHVRAGARSARGDRRRMGRPRAAARSGRGRAARVVRRRRAPRARARRLRAGPRRGRRRRLGRVPHRRRPAQLDGDASGCRAMGRRQRRGAHLDAIHLGHPRRGRERSLPAARQGARDLPLHGRRLRLEERAGRLHVHRSGAGQAHRAARQVRADAPRGERRCRQPQRDDPAPDDRRQARRHADRARRRVRQRGRLGRLVLRHGRTDADALRMRERQDDDVRREDQPTADEGVPRARVRRGDVRARGADGRARVQARRRPARAAPARTTPTTTPPTPARSAARS